jgi:hypothetical protein
VRVGWQLLILHYPFVQCPLPPLPSAHCCLVSVSASLPSCLLSGIAECSTRSLPVHASPCFRSHQIIPSEWLASFSEPELQVLISGSGRGIDIADLRKYTRYVGGFGAADSTIRRFWRVVEKFDAKSNAALLRFVTACERPPPLGFVDLQPPFTIQKVGGERLPAASTCFNILKLGSFSSDAVMRDKLLQAIFSGAGFEMS